MDNEDLYLFFRIIHDDVMIFTNYKNGQQYAFSKDEMDFDFEKNILEIGTKITLDSKFHPASYTVTKFKLLNKDHFGYNVLCIYVSRNRFE